MFDCMSALSSLAAGATISFQRASLLVLMMRTSFLANSSLMLPSLDGRFLSCAASFIIAHTQLESVVTRSGSGSTYDCSLSFFA